MPMQPRVRHMRRLRWHTRRFERTRDCGGLPRHSAAPRAECSSVPGPPLPCPLRPPSRVCVRACVGFSFYVAGSTWIYIFRLLLLVSATNPSFFVEAMCGFFLCCEACSAPPRIDKNTDIQSLHRKLLKHWSVSATSSEASQPYSHNSAGQIGGGEAAVLEASGRKRCVSRVVCGTRLPCLGSCLFRCKIVIYNIQLYNMYGRGLSG